MNKRCEYTKNIASMYRYHIVFCSRYRRRIFAIEGVEARFKELVRQICGQNNIEVLAMNCCEDYCHLYIGPPPNISPADAMKLIKSSTTAPLRKEFQSLSRCPTIWTRNYLVSTEANLSEETIQAFVDRQKRRK